jgi:chromosome segregation ATPase
MSEDQTRKLAETLAQILDRLTALEAKSYDTRPLHEQTRAALMEVRQELKEVRVELRRLNSNHEQMMIDLTNARSSLRDLSQRVEELEQPRH